MLLDKLQKITIDYVSQLPKEDADYCLKIESDYQTQTEQLRAIHALAHKIGVFETVDGLDTLQRKNAITYIKTVYNHFTYKYNIPLRDLFDYYERDFTPNLQDMIKHILSQLGGMSLSEKSYQEMVNDFKSLLVRYEGRPDFEVKGNTLTYHTCFVRADYYGYGYQNQTETIKKMRLIKYLDSLAWSQIYKYYQLNYYSTKNGNPFDLLELDGEWLKSIKQFKNGKVQIKFISTTKLQEFMALMGL